MINELVYQKDVPLLLKDPVALLIQLVLTVPATFKEVGYVFRSSNIINELLYQKDVSLLLKDPVALLIQLVLTVPATIERGRLCIQKL